jgi:hypothetical protein
MGRNDNRRSAKMRRKKAQTKLKARGARRLAANKANAKTAAPAKAAPAKRTKKKAAEAAE